ncbi:hypothetical protein ACFLUZ_01500 [Chloroflexota bacterium]
MQNCPNCGRPTLRTEDWACQWCGYPLLSGAFKKIPKTYKQLKEEELGRQRPPLREEPVPEPKPEPEVAPEPKPEPAPEPEVVPEPEAVPEPKPEPEVVPEPEAVPEPKPEPEVVPEPEAVPEPKPEPEVVPEPEAVPEPKPEPEVMPEPEPEAVPESKPEPEAAPEEELDPTTMKVTVEELGSAYKADRVAADAKYTNKTLKVTGVVAKVIVKDALDIHYILLTSAGREELWNVRGTFARQYGPELNRLTTGQTVTALGKYDGYERNILLKDCILVG